MPKLINLSIFLFLSLFSVNSQSNNNCDSFKLYNNDFNKLFQTEYYAIKSDTILAIHHCYSSNGCNRTFGLFCWKLNGQYYFKKIERKTGKRSRVKTTTKLSNELKAHFINFYMLKIYEKMGKVEANDGYYIDDGPLTTLLFKTTPTCWQFYCNVTGSKDTRASWITQLITIMN